MKEIEGNILVVDDEPDIRDIICTCLSQLDVNLIESDNGENALKELEKSRIDIIISDLTMPKMGGIEFLQTVRAQNWDLPFIVLTGHADRASSIEALRQGAFDFIEKPFKEGNLLDIVDRALNLSLTTQENLKNMQGMEGIDSSVKSSIAKLLAQSKNLPKPKKDKT